MTSRDKEMLAYLAAGFLAAVLVVWFLSEFHEELVRPFTEHLDTTIQAWVHAQASPTLTPIMRTLTWIGAPITVIPLCSAIAVALWVRGFRHQAALLLSSMLGASLLVIVLKLHFKRLRPDVSWSLVTEHSYSFPSGHSMMAVVLYGTLLYLLMRWLDEWWERVLASLAAFALAFFIGISRIYLGAHFPSDVLAGYLCGGIWLLTIAGGDLLVRRELQRWLAAAAR